MNAQRINVYLLYIRFFFHETIISKTTLFWVYDIHSGFFTGTYDPVTCVIHFGPIHAECVSPWLRHTFRITKLIFKINDTCAFWADKFTPFNLSSNFIIRPSHFIYSEKQAEQFRNPRILILNVFKQQSILLEFFE